VKNGVKSEFNRRLHSEQAQALINYGMSSTLIIYYNQKTAFTSVCRQFAWFESKGRLYESQSKN